MITDGLRYEFKRAYLFPWHRRIPWLGKRIDRWLNLGLLSSNELRQPWRLLARPWRKPVEMRWKSSHFGYFSAPPTITYTKGKP